VLSNLLLLALPASGKSEICRYLSHLDDEVRAADMGLGPLVFLDDFPYVFFMKRVSQELRRLGADPVFFAADEVPPADPRFWGMLIELLNEDFLTLGTARAPGCSARDLLARIEAAGAAVGAPPGLFRFEPEVLARLIDALEEPATTFAQTRVIAPPPPDATVIFEFARGGSEGADFETLAPRGYRHSLSLLRPDILEQAAILYIWVTPEESRHRNRERARSGGAASILHHHVPEKTMYLEYDCDDFAWLLDHSEQPGTVTVTTVERTFHVPAACLDNRVDRTSFLRAEPEEWPPQAVAGLHAALSEVLRSLQR